MAAASQLKKSFCGQIDQVEMREDAAKLLPAGVTL